MNTYKVTMKIEGDDNEYVDIIKANTVKSAQTRFMALATYPKVNGRKVNFSTVEIK